MHFISYFNVYQPSMKHIIIGYYALKSSVYTAFRYADITRNHRQCCIFASGLGMGQCLQPEIQVQPQRNLFSIKHKHVSSLFLTQHTHLRPVLIFSSKFPPEINLLHVCRLPSKASPIQMIRVVCLSPERRKSGRNTTGLCYECMLTAEGDHGPLCHGL